MGAALALLSNFFYLAKFKMAAISVPLYQKMAIKSLFLYQFSCVIYHFFQNFILNYMVQSGVSFSKNLK